MANKKGKSQADMRGEVDWLCTVNHLTASFTAAHFVPMGVEGAPWPNASVGCIMRDASVIAIAAVVCSKTQGAITAPYPSPSYW